MGNGKDADKSCHCHKGNGADRGAIYCLGVIGAAIYFIKTSTGFWMGVMGVFKAIFWPAVLVYKALELLRM